MSLLRKHKFKISFLFILATIGIVYNQFVRIDNYKVNELPPAYFSLLKGHVYFPGDTVFIEKFGDKNCSIKVVEIIKNDTIKVDYTSAKSIDLSKNNYNDLNPTGYSDFFIPKKEGIYLIELMQDDFVHRNAVFVNIAKNGKSKKIKIVLSDYNWTAYNEFGGRSHYSDKITPERIKYYENYHAERSPQYELNIFRPNGPNSAELASLVADSLMFKDSTLYHCIGGEIPLIKMLFESYNNDFEIIDCQAFEKCNKNTKDDLFIFNGHAEYWTQEMMDLLTILKKKNNVLFTSGNSVYRKVVREDRSLRVVETQIKDYETTKLIGSYYTEHGYMKNCSFKILQPTNFLFKGITAEKMGGNWVVSHELDKVNRYTPKSVEILAVGDTVPCDLILMNNGNGNYLLNTSSLGSYHGLREPNYKRFIQNFIDYSILKNRD